jgi:hypothetical protein
MNRRSRPAALAASLAVALALVAAARAADSPLDALFACQKIADGSARLTCLDREVAALHGGAQSGTVVAVDRNKLEESNYGLDRASVPLPTPESPKVPANTPADSPADSGIVRDKNGRVEGLENLAVARFDRTPYGQLIVELQNGQLWTQTDRITLDTPRRAPQQATTVSISNAALGSYKMQLNGKGAWFRVRRIN